MRIMRRLIVAPAVSVVLLASLAGAGPVAATAVVNGPSRVSSTPVTPEVASCGSTDGHYRGVAWSGFGSAGTEAEIWTWSHWSVTQPHNFSNEAVWLLDPNYGANSPYALEVGFYSGWFANNLNQPSVGWTNGMLPYYSTYDGDNVYVQKGAFLPSNTYIYIGAQIVGSDDFAFVGGQMDAEITNYPMNGDQKNLQNYEQGEVSNNGSWMGGGSGDAMTLYSLNDSGDARPWGFLHDCADSPYWASSSNGTDYFENGGY